MAEEEEEEGEGDKSRIKSASSQGWQALKKASVEKTKNLFFMSKAR